MNEKTNKTATAKPAAKTTKTSPAPAKPAAAPAPAKPAAKPAPDEGLHKLRVGDVFVGEKGVEMVVWFLNESRACVAPLNSSIKHRTDEAGVIRFAAGKESQNISPDSLVEVTRSLGRKGLADHIDNRDKQVAEESMKTKAPKKAATKAAKKEGTGTPGIRAGSLGSYQGFSIASVVRRLAKEGWKAPEIRAFLNAEKIECSDQTIKLNIYRANHPERPDSGEAAPLKTLPAKPKIAEKETKATAKPAAKKAAAKPAPAPAKKVPTAKAAPAAKPAAKPAAAPAKTPAQQVAALKAAKAAAKA